MVKIDRWFLRTSVLFALAGMALGIGMGIGQNFTLADAHAHINLVGWVTLTLYGLFYRVCPEAATGQTARVHYVIAALGALALVIGICGVMLHFPWGEPLAIVGALLTIIGMLIFAVIVYRRF